MPGDRHYDIIFCRNLLIYFDRPTQEGAIKVLDRLLAKNGVLFLGHAEGSLALSRWFSSARYPMAFAFTRSNDDRRMLNAAPKTTRGQVPRPAKRAIQERRKPAAPPIAPFTDLPAPARRSPWPTSRDKTTLSQRPSAAPIRATWLKRRRCVKPICRTTVRAHRLIICSVWCAMPRAINPSGRIPA